MNLIISDVLQVIVACTLLSVWLVQAKKTSPYRGGNAQNLEAEFKVYRLPKWSFYTVGALKVSAALALLGGIGFRPFVFPASIVLVILMIGAVVMHIKVSDPLKKSIPAAMLLLFCAGIALLN